MSPTSQPGPRARRGLNGITVLGLCFAVVVAFLASGPGSPSSDQARAARAPGLEFETNQITSLGEIRSIPDSTRHYLYGGPGTVEGKFQQFLSYPGGLPNRQGWIGVDLSEVFVPEHDGAGDFSKLFMGLMDIDPCFGNITPQMTFIDDGTPPSNFPMRSTGGSSGINWWYGVPGGFVVNYTDGVSLGGIPLANEIWSPPMLWDLPGTEDDAAGLAILEFDLWDHLPLEYGMFWTWRVRFTTAGGSGWSEWQPNPDLPIAPSQPWAEPGFGYSDRPRYRRVRQILPVASAESLQVALGVIDLSDVLGLPGMEATPAPWFDNVSVAKLYVGDPVIRIDAMNLFHDAFPQDGTTTGGVRLDVARQMDEALAKRPKDPGDSIWWTSQSGSDGMCVSKGLAKQDVAESRLVAVMKIQCNPDHPGWPAPCADALVVDPRYNMTLLGDDLVRFEVLANHRGPLSPACPDTVCPQVYAADLPDAPEAAVFYPGSVIHYYIECIDCGGAVATLPSNLGGFLDFSPTTRWDPRFTVHALPTPEGRLAGVQPEVLLWLDGEGEQAEPIYDPDPQVPMDRTPSLWRLALANLGLLEGIDYDVYTTRAPNARQGNGLGSAGDFGATPAQLAGYRYLIYGSNRQSACLISDGSDVLPNDSSDDVGLLAAWHEWPAERYHIYFGDDFAEGMYEGGATARSYLQNVLGVTLLASSLGAAVGFQQVPPVVPTTPPWSHSYVAYGACPRSRYFDRIGLSDPTPPDPTKWKPTHGFTDEDGVPYDPVVPAGILWDRLEGGFRKATVVFPYAFEAIYDPSQPSGGAAISERAHLLGETLSYMGYSGGGLPVATPEQVAGRLVVRPSYPNPFNPRTTIEYSAPTRGKLRVRVFDLRGRLVDTVFEGPVAAGPGAVVWRGTDREGRAVASGVYICEIEGFGRRHTQKLALLR